MSCVVGAVTHRLGWCWSAPCWVTFSRSFGGFSSTLKTVLQREKSGDGESHFLKDHIVVTAWPLSSCSSCSLGVWNCSLEATKMHLPSPLSWLACQPRCVHLCLPPVEQLSLTGHEAEEFIERIPCTHTLVVLHGQSLGRGEEHKSGRWLPRPSQREEPGRRWYSLSLCWHARIWSLSEYQFPSHLSDLIYGFILEVPLYLGVFQT